jgi:hypothetical protein
MDFRSTELGAAIACPCRIFYSSCVKDLSFADVGHDGMVFAFIDIVCSSY